MPPELYATPWFLTYFAAKVHDAALYRLWDYFLLADDNQPQYVNRLFRGVNRFVKAGLEAEYVEESFIIYQCVARNMCTH